ncbi:MAG: bifunctional protein-serine/threonine kinase/phosphatase [Gammaproteobacteria bacterium]|nr:bifunctional protein-serine/threonine kinase/phosphatase [Gammaproteobacteria bacterium]
MTGKLTVSIGQSSDKGIKPQNEDSYGVLSPDDKLLDSKGIAAIVADGMGSCAYPREASEYCVKGFFSDYYSTADSWTVKTSAAKVLTALNSWLYGKSSNDQVRAYVSTFSALIIKSTTAHIFQIGDSRIYRFRDGMLEQLTQDHRVWFSQEKNYLSRAIGIDLHLDIDYKTLEAEVDDLFIMTTDGVHDYVSDQQLKNLLTGTGDLDVIADKIVMMALEQQSHDNVTCQIIRVDKLPSQTASEVYRELAKLPFPPELEPGMELDGYRILREISASPTSQLYLVEDRASGQHMVMKTPSVNYDDDPSYIERFHLEEWAGKRLRHKNILATYEQTRPRNFLYFLMEYIDGQTLAQWIQQNPTPDIKIVTGIIEQLIQGIRAIHRMEMLHRDLKPDNIILTPDGIVKIIDFGSIKIAGIQEISTPVERLELLGTRNYTAPEYLIGMAGSNKSDLFSLGIICYQMLTGKLPYGDRLNRNSNWRSISKIRYISALNYNPMIPLWLDGAIEKAVRCDARMRYETFSEFFHDLTHPNNSFMKQNLPLIEKNPLVVWQLIAAILAIGNVILAYLLLN